MLGPGWYAWRSCSAGRTKRAHSVTALAYGSLSYDLVITRGLYVIPGAVDGHVHLADPTFPPYAVVTADSFATGTRAAAFGGVTTVVDFAQPAVGQSLLD